MVIFISQPLLLWAVPVQTPRRESGLIAALQSPSPSGMLTCTASDAILDGNYKLLPAPTRGAGGFCFCHYGPKVESGVMTEGIVPNGVGEGMMITFGIGVRA